MLKIIVKRRKDGRILTLSFVFLFIILWILIGFNFKNPDYEYYENFRNCPPSSFLSQYTTYRFIAKLPYKVNLIMKKQQVHKKTLGSRRFLESSNRVSF